MSPLNDERLEAAQRLYLENYGELYRRVLDDSTINAIDAAMILENLAKHLPAYDGLPTLESFAEWASGVMAVAAFLHDLYRQCRPYVRAAILEIIGNDGRFDTPGAVMEELESDTWLWCHKHVEELRTPGKAQLTTRVYKRAQWIARAWRTNQLRRLAVVERELNRGTVFQVEYLSDEELAEMAGERELTAA